jgi:peptidoglycan/xylan/chitin deacetylase (PgdA/CDA1 family)
MLLKAIRRLAKLAISAGYLAIAPGRRRPGGPVVLLYHEVTAAQARRFARQLDRLSHVARIVPARRGGLPSVAEGNAVALTFDDAFAGLWRHALPELAHRRIPATIFVPTGYLGARPGWIEDPAHPNHDETVAAAADLRRLDFSLFDLGSHGVSHARLSSLGDALLHDELAASKARLEHLTGAAVRALALPYGDLDERVLALAAAAGYAEVFLDRPYLPDEPRDGLLRERINVSPDDWAWELALKAKGAYAWTSRLRALRRRRARSGARPRCAAGTP